MTEKKFRVVDETTIFGPPPTAEQTAAANVAIRALVETYNSLNPELRDTVLLSFFVSLCMGTSDPRFACTQFAEHALEAIAVFEGRPRGHG